MKQFINEETVNLGKKIGVIKGIHEIADGVYLAKWSSWNIDVLTEKGIESFETNIGLKTINKPVFVKCKDNLLTIYKIIKQ
ncbi:MAG: hypothetical protein GY849_02515 [Deltaproteobacteria bacterium]|nr:hypothetical protein [Deltaproteobacteria bacterium]